jgi:pentatricopeptide repeat domain-containing protein 1
MRPSSLSFNALIEACTETQRLDRAFDVLGSMKRLGVRANTGTYSLLIEACAKGRDLPKAISVLQEMGRMGEPPDVSCFNTVIRICGDVNKVDFAFQILEYMMSLQLPPNSFTFAELIEACSLAGDLRRATSVLYEMRSAGWSPSKETLKAVYLACARSNDPISALISLFDPAASAANVAVGSGASMVLQATTGLPKPTGAPLLLAVVETLAAAGRHADAVEFYTAQRIEQMAIDPPIVYEAVNRLQGEQTNEASRRLLQLLQKKLQWAQQQPSAVQTSAPEPASFPQSAAAAWKGLDERGGPELSMPSMPDITMPTSSRLMAPPPSMLSSAAAVMTTTAAPTLRAPTPPGLGCSAGPPGLTRTLPSMVGSGVGLHPVRQPTSGTLGLGGTIRSPVDSADLDLRYAIAGSGAFEDDPSDQADGSPSAQKLM